jgi:hypothetical protein
MWWFFVGITLSSKIWTKWPFWWILPSFEPRMKIVDPLDASSSLRKIVVSLPQKPIRLSSCSKHCRFIILSESFQNYLSGGHFCQPWARVYEFLVTLKIHMITMLLSIVWWPLLDRYLLEVYLTPHSSDSPCAPHVVLAIKEHLVCGANSRWFSHAQKLSL